MMGVVKVKNKKLWRVNFKNIHLYFNEKHLADKKYSELEAEFGSSKAHSDSHYKNISGGKILGRSKNGSSGVGAEYLIKRDDGTLTTVSSSSINNSDDFGSNKHSGSKKRDLPLGVYSSRNDKFRAAITIDHIQYTLGTFLHCYDAENAYKTALKNWETFHKIPFKKHSHPGVTRRLNKWGAYITINYVRIWLGTFDTYEDALSARKRAERNIA